MDVQSITHSLTDSLVATGLTKHFGKTIAVDDLSFILKQGEIVAFLGINGAGKSTTIKMLVGILQPNAGSIAISGHDIGTTPLEAKKLLGYVPDRPYLYERLTAREYMYFLSSMYGVPKQHAHERISKLLQDFSLNEIADKLIGTYSHGMKQRTALAGALTHEPRFFVIDEPMVGLDPHGAKFLKKYLKDLAVNGCGIIVSTHSLNVAEEIADRIIIIHQGKIIKEQRVADLATQESLEQQFISLTQ